jgi:hypothetical protein
VDPAAPGFRERLRRPRARRRRHRAEGALTTSGEARSRHPEGSTHPGRRPAHGPAPKARPRPRAKPAHDIPKGPPTQAEGLLTTPRRRRVHALGRSPLTTSRRVHHPGRRPAHLPARATGAASTATLSPRPSVPTTAPSASANQAAPRQPSWTKKNPEVSFEVFPVARGRFARCTTSFLRG